MNNTVEFEVGKAILVFLDDDCKDAKSHYGGTANITLLIKKGVVSETQARKVGERLGVSVAVSQKQVNLHQRRPFKSKAKALELTELFVDLLNDTMASRPAQKKASSPAPQYINTPASRR